MGALVAPSINVDADWARMSSEPASQVSVAWDACGAQTAISRRAPTPSSAHLSGRPGLASLLAATGAGR